MKILVFLASTPIPLYNVRSSISHLHIPLISMSPDFLASLSTLNPIISSSTFQNKKPFNFSMAACIHSSRTETRRTNSKIDNNVYSYVKYCRQSFPDLGSCVHLSEKNTKTLQKDPNFYDDFDKNEDEDELWLKMRDEARSDIKQEPILCKYYLDSILRHDSLQSALGNHLSMKLCNSSLPNDTLRGLFHDLLSKDEEIFQSIKADLIAVKERDPACISYVHCFLSFKGFLACQAHRVAHKLWLNDRKILALLIQNRVSEVLSVDIHPGAKIGKGILLDHATGVVVGETAVIGNNVSILHNVTLGGTGKTSGDRHPKIGDGVLIGAGTCVLGNVRVEDGAKIGAGSVVLKEVPARTTAVGNPAKLIGGKENPFKLDKIPSFTMDHTSDISEWSDYVI